MDIKGLRALMDTALESEGLERRKLRSGQVKAWAMPAGDIVRLFAPHAFRRPWGFVFAGGIGVEVPALRAWLTEHKSKEEVGIFHTWFTGYYTANDDVLGRFMIEHGCAVPADLWAGLIRDALERIPPSLDELVTAYRRNRESLGWLAHPHHRHAWDFLLKWRENPDPSLSVPRILPDGRIVH